MAGEHLTYEARRVISGLDANGKSTIVSDENAPSRLAAPAWTVINLWQVNELPVNVDDADSLGAVTLLPPFGTLMYRLAVFPPDSEVNPAAILKSLEVMGGGDSHRDDNEIAGLHQTDTLEIITILSGEVYAVLETAETLLKAGDTFVQRGTKHAWSNRSDKPATIAALVIPANR